MGWPYPGTAEGEIMADYRQECNYDGCGYTGFSGHSQEHLSFIRAEEYRKKQEEATAKALDKERWDSFFEGMDDEALFRYMSQNQKAIARVRKNKVRMQKAREYMLRTYKMHRYMDWCRKNG